MNNVTLSTATISALRLVRFTAWLIVAFLLGAQSAARTADRSQLPSQQPASHLIGASTCGCAANLESTI